MNDFYERDYPALPEGAYRDEHNMLRTPDGKLLPDGSYRYMQDGEEAVLLYEGNSLAIGKDWYKPE